MKKNFHLLLLTFIILLSSCGSEEIKYSPGDSWNIKLNDEYSIECHFEQITNEELIFTLKKENPDDSYNFAIQEDIHCDYIYVNDKMISSKTIGVVPISFYDVEEFSEINNIKIHFRDGTEEYKKINIESCHTFFPEGNKKYIGIYIKLYKF